MPKISVISVNGKPVCAIVGEVTLTDEELILWYAPHTINGAADKYEVHRVEVVSHNEFPTDFHQKAWLKRKS